MIIGGIVGFCLWVAFFGWVVMSLKHNEKPDIGVLCMFAAVLIGLGLSGGYLVSLIGA